MKCVTMILFIAVAFRGGLAAVDFTTSPFFCPWVFGPDAKRPEELTYFNTTDPNEVSSVAASKWDAATNAGRLYFLLYAKYRDADLYEKLEKRAEEMEKSSSVEIRNGSSAAIILFTAARKKIRDVRYDWAGVPTNW